ncbi:histone-lysine N-methyltransferase SETDB2 isoform X1 [Mastacembelus armatus]|uniref:histone-lysine N-methyltransferase SETDB2 isoform X1 n=1 Tax=Mastacembelus armatus TaxID=205130 RepID=UPI000E45904F|nr:histone-lysine N-methyltransferase SETDB2-like isoform X1 [Mastacembelus armatus]
MEEDSLDPQDVEKAKSFWAEEDVDPVFERVFVYLHHLKTVLNNNTATDKEFVQGLKLLELLDLSPPVSSPDSFVVQVVIGSAEPLPTHFSNHSPSLSPSSSLSACNGPPSPAAPPAGREELLPPLVPLQLQYQPHSCSKACLTGLPSMPQSMPPFWGQNPLKVPLLCGFKRLSAMPLSPREGGACDRDGVGPTVFEVEEGQYLEDLDIVYKAPCGQSLRNHDDVARFLLATESYDILRLDFFTFNPYVQLNPPLVAGPRRPELDLSLGREPTPVELCAGNDGARPPDFRYRKDRWPHGCFLSNTPMLFKACCDCTDGCNSSRCTCVAMTTGGRTYTHHRLTEPIPSGLYECGPWCGCDRARCQNRLVQGGIRVRLQVFQTSDRGWGVRCRDDLDLGTFVCIYAGVVLQRVLSPVEPPPQKLIRTDLPSDDEVEVVTEWLALPVLKRQSSLLETPLSASPILHIPVVQKPTDDGDKDQTSAPSPEVQVLGGSEPTSPSADDQSQAQESKVATTTASPRSAANWTKSDMSEQKSLKRAVEENVYFLDASKEGNVSRFLNHSCQPNLFVQNVFTDTHDPGFPIMAFFTDRVVKAGTELTWNYCADTETASLQKQEVPCLCGSSACQGLYTIKEDLRDVCEVEGRGLVGD